jgi:hypothetical protein
MVDRVSASIAIGGNLPSTHLTTFTALIVEEGLSLDWDCEPFVPSQCTSGSPLVLMAHEVALGQFDALENFCITQGLPFSRWSAGCRAWGAQRCIFTGEGDLRIFPVDAEDDVLIDRATVMELGSVEAILAYLDAADFAVPPLLIVTPADPSNRENDHG